MKNKLSFADSGLKRWFNDRRLGTKIFSILALLMGLFTLTALLFLRNQSEIRDELYWTDHTTQVLASANSMQTLIPQQVADLRGYAIFYDRSLLDDMRRASAVVDSELRTLLKLTADNPEQQARLHTIEALIQQWHENFSEPALRFANDGEHPEKLLEFVREGRGRALSDELDTRVREVINVESSLLNVRSGKLADGLTQIRTLAIITLIFGVGFSLFALVAVRRTVAAPLSSLEELVGRLSDGELTVAVPHMDRSDEIGAIARSIEAFRKASREVQKREWIKRHLSEISGMLSQQHDYEAFSQIILSYLCPLIGAGYGLLFRVHTDGMLEQMGSYGFKERRGRARETDQGLAAECARSKRPITLEQVPGDYLKIASGLGEATPKTVRLLPLAGIEGVVGVLEFASFSDFDAATDELLTEAALLTGLAFESLTNALRTRELLEETRAQSEELQASEEALRVQQEELRTANEALGVKNSALEEQSKRLLASEEELRVQSEELRTTNEVLGDKSRTLNEFNEKLLLFQKELEKKNADLEQASRYKSEFLANMSHELRTPLNSLLILAKDLADNGGGNLDAEQIEAAQIIHDSGHNLLGLINDILDLSKIEAGRMDVDWEVVTLTELATQAERNFRRSAKERALEFAVTLADGLPQKIQSDAAKVMQILTNLLGNAFKFTHDGSVRLNVSRPDADLPVLGELPREQTIAISVSDSGIGIEPEKLARLFQPFEQGDGTTSRRYGGTGLGLSISRALAQMLGGEIVVQSTVGNGSRFTLLLPEQRQLAANAPAMAVASAASAPAATPTPAPAPAPAPARVSSTLRRPPPISDDREQIRSGDVTMLIVEDDGAFARVLADITRRKGYRVLLASDGESGLELARRFHPNGILLDVDLPVMSGWTVMEQLKADPATRHIPVHFVTATDEASRGMAMGAVGFLTKPATRESLDAAFQRVLHFADGQRRRLLVVEDEPGARLAIGKLLAGQPIEIHEADTAARGLDRLSRQTFDCVILDLTLPDASGFEFLERLAGRGPVPPVVIYSARDLTRDEDLRLREYTDSIVIKGAQSPGRLLDEVSLFLHAVRQPASPTATAQTPTPSDLAGRTVLVVDDDMRNVFALSKALRGQGLIVLVAQDGHRALAQLEEHQEIDWVLMDVMMPGMDGYTATREIRKRPQWRDLPVITVTAKAMPGDREKCLEAGASDYLTKPIDIERLLSMLRAWRRQS